MQCHLRVAKYAGHFTDIYSLPLATFALQQLLGYSVTLRESVILDCISALGETGITDGKIGQKVVGKGSDKYHFSCRA